MSYLHFTLGPVQSFVSQARRTRDFWAGSFLLSWLSGVAMLATEALGGEIIFPIPPGGTSKNPLPSDIKQRYLAWIEDSVSDEDRRRKDNEDRYLGPRIGAIPNRFMAKVPLGFGAEQAEQVAKAVREAWMALATQVWKTDELYELPQASEVLDIWERQNQHFWEITWVITDEKTDSAALDRRKNWRSHLLDPEPGVKCHLMEGLQELSGIETMRGDSNQRRRDFWENLRKTLTRGKTDLGEKEMLCAVAYVKRRFVHVFGGLNQTIELGDNKSIRIKGWKLACNMPSVSYMAAVVWLNELLKQPITISQWEDLHARAIKAGSEHGEWDTRIPCLEQVIANKPSNEQAIIRRCIALDGNIFFRHVQDSPKSYDLNANISGVREWLDAVKKQYTEFAKQPLSPFYAVLMMDGDSLGKHMSNSNNQPVIAKALNAFTANVRAIVEGENGHAQGCYGLPAVRANMPTIVEGENGLLIYAGGDDVLALLPLEKALICAAKLRKAYLCAFATHLPENSQNPIPTTLSGAIIYAHVKTPLGEVLRQAHKVLDDVAKDGAGRDAIAVRVLKPGGEHLTWAQPWLIALRNGQVEIARLADDFQKAEGKQPGEFSSKFFFKLRARFQMLAGMRPGEVESVLAADYLASEPARGADNKKVTLAEAKEFIRDLLEQCRPAQRDPDKPDNPKTWQRDPARADAALLVRFLANKGVEADR